MESPLDAALDGHHSSLVYNDGDHSVELPLLNIHYQVKIVGHLGNIHIKQEYANPFNFPLHVRFLFPININFCLVDLKAVFGNTTL